MKVFEFPLARITVAFLLGILIAFYFAPNPNVVFGIISLSLIVLAILFFSSKNTKKDKRYFSIVCYFISSLIGMSSLMVQNDSFKKDNYSNNDSLFENKNEHNITLILREKLKNNVYNHRYIALVQSIDNKIYSGRIILSIPKKEFSKQLEIGTKLRIKGYLQKNKKPDNPNQFDYGNYLNQKQIYAQLYAKPENIEISPNFNKDVWFYIAKINSRIIRNLEKSNFDKTSLAVATALILGQRQDIAPEIIRDYQYAGAVHILSVSVCMWDSFSCS